MTLPEGPKDEYIVKSEDKMSAPYRGERKGVQPQFLVTTKVTLLEGTKDEDVLKVEDKMAASNKAAENNALLVTSRQRDIAGGA